MTVGTPPTPRRLARPKWMDVRVIGGVLLLVVSIAVGSKVIGAATRTIPVWAIAHDVAAGTVLAQKDLVAAEVNLGERAGTYTDATANISGRILNRALSAGELVPAAALGEVGDLRVVSVAVAPEHVAPSVAHGSVVDLYLITGRGGVAGSPIETRLLQGGVTIQSVTAPASGGLSGAVSSRYQIALALSVPDADRLVRELPLGEPLLVAHAAGATTGVADR